jgi:hypothetical protein
LWVLLGRLTASGWPQHQTSFVIAPTGFLKITTGNDKFLYGLLTNNGTIQDLGGTLKVYDGSALSRIRRQTPSTIGPCQRKSAASPMPASTTSRPTA